jgi:hypothetical protein
MKQRVNKQTRSKERFMYGGYKKIDSSWVNYRKQVKQQKKEEQKDQEKGKNQSRTASSLERDSEI